MSQSIRVENVQTIIGASQINVGNGLRPSRIVLRDDGHQFIVHLEIFTIGVVDQVVTFTHDSFENGHYFRYGDFTKREDAHKMATQDFADRS